MVTEEAIMPTMIDIRELPARLDEMLARAAAGDEVVLLDGDAPRARLVPVEAPRERILGLHPGAIWTTPDFDDPLPEEFWAGRQ
jgi:antitoxin (DNA-binding transcriptional repressor) of toxin-antitoxin stability system